MKTPLSICLLILSIAFVQAQDGELFRFKFAEGDSWRINSVVRQKVYVNRQFSHSAEITNRITVRVSDVRDGSARHDCTFMTSERTSNRSFSWGREYESVFRRNELGSYDIADSYFMPVVRNVPTFPEGPVSVGQSWKGTGIEAHDLRDHYGIEKPFTVPFDVVYTYDGQVDYKGKQVHLIRAEYTLFSESPKNHVPKAGDNGKVQDYPVSTLGHSKQELFWDNDLGLIPYYRETYRIQLTLASGTVLLFTGDAEAFVTESALMDRKQIAKEMNEEISRLGIADVRAEDTDNGVTISIENIQFEADSARLTASEQEKITRIAALLERYPDKELLISGHTALAGTASGRQKLSEERAASVARFLVEMGVRSEYNVYTRGFGADKPIAPNDSEVNRSRNRRVEITILEK